MQTPATTALNVQEITLLYRRFTAQHRIMAEMLLDAPPSAVEFAVERGAHTMVATLNRHMATLEADGPLLHTPADWWQHFKERWFPAWALMRWPVRYTEHNATMMFPDVPKIPGSSDYRFAVWNDALTWTTLP